MSASKVRSAARRRTAVMVPILTAVVFFSMLGFPPPASAHVTVDAPGAEPGAYAQLTFSVPTESRTESTVRIEIELPVDAGIRSVRTVPVPGWNAELVRETLPAPIDDGHGGTIDEVVRRVVFTAASRETAIGVDETGRFVVALGPLPDHGTVYFPALQTYDSGREVFWSQQATGGADPELPAPSIALGTPSPSGDADAGIAAGAIGGGSTTDGTDPADIAAVVLGAAGAVFGGVALIVSLRRRGPDRDRDHAAGESR